MNTANNKNYMSIGVSVRTTKFAARNSGIGVRQESNPQSPTAYSSVRYLQAYPNPFHRRNFTKKLSKNLNYSNFILTKSNNKQ